MCVLEIAGGVLAVSGLLKEYQQINYQKKLGNYQAALMLSQGKQAEQEAAYQRQEGIEEARRQKLNAILKMGDKKTAIAGSHIALSSQTALNAVEDEKINGELNALTTLKKSEHSAQAYIERANDYYRNAGLKSFQTKNNYRKGLLDLGMNSLEFGINPGITLFNQIKSKINTKKKVL